MDLRRLHEGPQDDLRGPDEIVNWMAPEYEGHANYGLVGIDPRAHASAEVGREETERLLDYLAAWVIGEAHP